MRLRPARSPMHFSDFLIQFFALGDFASAADGDGLGHPLGTFDLGELLFNHPPPVYATALRMGMARFGMGRELPRGTCRNRRSSARFEFPAAARQPIGFGPEPGS